MSSERKDTLKKRLDENYTAFIESLQEKTVSELIAMAPEITAGEQLHTELLDACDDEDMEFLLRFDDPLEVVRGYWESEITGYDHSGEMGHMLWRIREDNQDEFEQQDEKSFGIDEITLDPVMDFSGKEVVAYIEIGFDVGRRFQVYPNLDDSYGLYVKYDPVSQVLRAELCIEDGYDGGKRWETVLLLPSEQKMIISLMEEVCQKDMGRSLRDTWADHHPAIDKARTASSFKEARTSPVAPYTSPKPKIQLAYPGEDVYSVLHRAVKTLKGPDSSRKRRRWRSWCSVPRTQKTLWQSSPSMWRLHRRLRQKEKTDQERGKPRMSDNTAKHISADDLRRMEGQEGLVLQGCGGPPQEWVNGINQELTEAGILLNGSKLENVVSFRHDGVTNLLFPFGDAELHIGKFAMWRLQTHNKYGGTWLSDYVPNRLGGFLHQPSRQKPTMSLIGMDGNIFAVMGKASSLLKEAGMGDLVDHMVQRVTTCGDYYKALNIISEYVETELSPPAMPQKSQKKKERNAHER